MRIRNLVAGAATVLLVGVGVIVPSATASAHTHDVDSTCQGLSVTLSNYANDSVATHKNTVKVVVDGTVKTDNPDFGSSFSKTYSYDDETVDHTYRVKVTAYDNDNYSFDTGTVTQKGCPDTGDKKIKFCHWSEHFNGIETSVNAFYNSGHIDHGKDIYPAGSYTKGGHTFSWDAQGDQSLLQYWDTDCVKPDVKDATASVSTTPATCQSPGTATFSIEHATWATGAETEPGTYTRTANAVDGHVFADGSKSKTVTYTIEDVLNPNEPPCYTAIKVIPNPPAVKDLCGTDNDHYGLPTGPEGITYSRDGKAIVATLATGYAFGALPEGWALNENGTATFAFNPASFTDVPCNEVVIPAPPVLKDLCGTVNDHYGLPANTEHLAYSRSGKDLVVTLVGNAVFGTLPTGWVAQENGTALFAFDQSLFSSETCDVPLPTLFNAEPTPATCDTDGTFDTSGFSGEFPNVTVTLSSVEPGTITITVTPNAGYSLSGLNPDKWTIVEGVATRTVVIPTALGNCPAPNVSYDYDFDCGVAVIVFWNDQEPSEQSEVLAAEDGVGHYSVDGVAHTVAVPANTDGVEVDLAFGEDTGNHVVTVEGTTTFTVGSDCEHVVTKPKPPKHVVHVVHEAPPAPVTPPVTSLSRLPHTGIDSLTPIYWGLGLVLFGSLLIGGLTFLKRREA